MPVYSEGKDGVSMARGNVLGQADQGAGMIGRGKEVSKAQVCRGRVSGLEL